MPLQQGQFVALDIVDLADSGDGVGRYENLTVFVPDTVPGDRVEVKIDFRKLNFARAGLVRLLRPSPDRVRPPCIVADKCGGCQWQAIAYERQLQAKQNNVLQALQRLGGFPAEHLAAIAAPIASAPEPLHYRNKATYPLARSLEGKVKAGYYQKGTHKLINLNQCPVQDYRLDPLLAHIKEDIQRRGWSIYNERTREGRLRHLGLRVGRRTGEMLLTLVSHSSDIPELGEQARAWMERYPRLVGVLLNHNPSHTNEIFGDDTRCIAGRDYLTEVFAGLRFQLRGDTFFQVYTEQAEKMVTLIAETLQFRGTELLLDAYAGIGTLTLPFAQKVRHAIAIEVQPQAVEQCRQNAAMNEIANVEFFTGTVETILPTLAERPDIAILDPPRKGCHADAIAHLRAVPVPQLAYVSCNPATLARDLKLLCAEDVYSLTRVQPMDFFPQTTHVETVAFLHSAAWCP